MKHLLVLFLVMSLRFISRGGSSYAETTSPAEYSWEEIIREKDLSDVQISALRRNGILVTDEAYKQIFTAYILLINPVFITSDSLLNAYHVLYEESVFRLESEMASRLPDILRHIMDNIENVLQKCEGDPELLARAGRLARLVPGIALRLIDDSFHLKQEDLDAILEKEVEKIVQADGIGRPGWHSESDVSALRLDYSRHKPRGFYTRTEDLSRYFRAVSWLQSIPFRIKKDEELAAVAMLSECLDSKTFTDPVKLSDTRSFFQAYRKMIGVCDDSDLNFLFDMSQDFTRWDSNDYDFREWRDYIVKKAMQTNRRPLINDQIRFPPDDSSEAWEPDVRIISAYRTPSAILFQRTTDIRRFMRDYPEGLEVAAALGSPFARNNIHGSQRSEILKETESCRAHFQGKSLYYDYLDALKTLLDPPDLDGPDFMKREAWQLKSCNTVLAGWAQLCHTWILQSKQAVRYLSDAMLPVGFVEPEPDFFSKMADLAEKTRLFLRESNALKPDYTQVLRALSNYRSGLLKEQSGLSEDYSVLSDEARMDTGIHYMLSEMNPVKRERGSDAYFQKSVEWIDTLIADVKNGRVSDHPALESVCKEYNHDLNDLWIRFEKLSRRLEVIALKQLRGSYLNDSDAAFIKSYGKELAEIMLYRDSARSHPRDDAPRIVDVFYNPLKKGYLQVGVCRARKLYVLYPWKGKRILCEGAIMPYYEFVSGTRLTDEEWRKILDSDQRPPIPKWMLPIVSGRDLGKPAFSRRP